MKYETPKNGNGGHINREQICHTINNHTQASIKHLIRSQLYNISWKKSPIISHNDRVHIISCRVSYTFIILAMPVK